MKSGVIQIGHDQCPNCKILKPIMEKVCKDLGIEYLEINMIKNPQILAGFAGANIYQYQVAPTAFYVKDNVAQFPPIAEGSIPTMNKLKERIERLK